MAEEIDRWGAYRQSHPDTWKQAHKEFINAQFQKQEQFLRRLLKMPQGKKKAREVYDVHNPGGYPSFFTPE
ncbi:hypothetical protein GF367_00910 [Candidatus Woesearchaeota archaeon]|nr:hypothetical protein [Candidatus Woesearchaeota archaeon]